MAQPNESRLALVATPVEAGDDEHATEPTPSRRPPPDHRIPFCIRLTIEQVLNVAEDASLRAQMLEWSTEGIAIKADVLRRVSGLHKVAIDLRRAAADLSDGWGASEGSP